MEDSLTVGMRARDRSGQITYVNPAFCRMVGFSAEELIGQRSPNCYWAPEEMEQTQRLHDSVMEGRAPSEGFELAIKLSRMAIKATQPDAAMRDRLRPDYAENADSLIAVSQVVATNFATIAAANDHWRGGAMSVVRIDGEDFIIEAEDLASAFGMEAEEVLRRLSEGLLTTRCEKGVGEHDGRHRLTFSHEGRVLRLTGGAVIAAVDACREKSEAMSRS